MQTALQNTAIPATPLFWAIDENAWKVRSKSRPGLAHTIRRQSDGTLACNCPARSACWHLKALAACGIDEQPEVIPQVQDPDDAEWEERAWGTVTDKQEARPVIFDVCDPKNRIYL